MGGWNEPLFLVSPYRAHIRSAHARLRPLRRLRRFFLMGAATPPLPRRGVPFGCFATFIEKSAHLEFLEVRSAWRNERQNHENVRVSDLRTNDGFSVVCFGAERNAEWADRRTDT